MSNNLAGDTATTARSRTSRRTTAEPRCDPPDPRTRQRETDGHAAVENSVKASFGPTSPPGPTSLGAANRTVSGCHKTRQRVGAQATNGVPTLNGTRDHVTPRSVVTPRSCRVAVDSAAKHRSETQSSIEIEITVVPAGTGTASNVAPALTVRSNC